MTPHPAPAPPHVVPPVPECWRRIGTSGDRSCPELTRFVHCRNCPVLAAAARRFFDRPAPPGYRESWQAILEQPLEVADAAAVAVLVFRASDEWLALPTAGLVEVATPRPIHPLPHRAGTPLLGVVNVRGQLHPAFAGHALLELPAPTSGRPDAARLLLIAGLETPADGGWVILVDEVAGIHRLALDALRPAPATVRSAALQATEALFDWQGRRVGLLDLSRLLDRLASHASGGSVRLQEAAPWMT